MWPIMGKNIHVDYLLILKREILMKDTIMNVTLNSFNVICVRNMPG